MDRKERVTRGKNRKIQLRKARKDGFSAAKRQVYLDTLAMCCTVSAAAAAAGVSVTTILYHRHRDPAFASAEAEALEAGYFMLEAASVAHGARGGRYVPGGTADPATPGAEALEPETALRLLAMRGRGIGRRTGDGGQRARRVSERDLNESLLAKLELLGRRRGIRKHEARKLKTVDAARAALEGTGTSNHRVNIAPRCSGRAGGHDRPNDPR
jgi:hypothetical protein